MLVKGAPNICNISPTSYDVGRSPGPGFHYNDPLSTYGDSHYTRSPDLIFTAGLRTRQHLYTKIAMHNIIYLCNMTANVLVIAS